MSEASGSPRTALARILPEKDQIQVETVLEDKFAFGSVLASVSYRPGQCVRSDGYILEDKELEFYLKKTQFQEGQQIRRLFVSITLSIK